MALNNYANFRTVVADYLDRSDLSDQIEDAIDLLEAKLNRRFRHPDMVTRDDSFTVDSQYEAVPTDAIETIRIVLDTSPATTLEFISQEEMAQKRWEIDSQAKPIYFTVVGGNYEFLPQPGSSYTASVVYYKRITALASGATNWIFDNHPDVYLYGTLLEMEPFVMNDERLVVWERMFEKAVREIELEGEKMKFGGTPSARTRAFGY